MSNEMSEVQRTLGRLEEKIDSVLGAQKEIPTLRDRINSLERQGAWQKGALAVLGLLWMLALKLLPSIK